jgi:hypothetical protein
MGVQDFIFHGSWYDKRYQANSGDRYPTFKAALNLLSQLKPAEPVVVETGCQREMNDWGAGCSTTLFLDYLREYHSINPEAGDKKGHLFSVDISSRSCELARHVSSGFGPSLHTVTQMDSAEYLKKFKGKIDLLYLDSWDYPIVEMCDLYGNRRDLTALISALGSLGEEEVIRRHGHMFAACQEHCVKEVDAGLPLLHERSIILIDDNDLPGGGKSRLAKRYLATLGWRCILDARQTLWIQK